MRRCCDETPKNRCVDGESVILSLPCCFTTEPITVRRSRFIIIMALLQRCDAVRAAFFPVDCLMLVLSFLELARI